MTQREPITSTRVPAWAWILIATVFIVILSLIATVELSSPPNSLRPVCEPKGQGGPYLCPAADVLLYCVSQLGDPTALISAIAAAIIAWFTIVLARVTRRQANFTERLARIGERQADIAEKQAGISETQIDLSKKSARAAEQSANAAQEAVKATERMSENVVVSERAYVKMSHIPPGLKFINGGDLCHVTIEVRNSGRTPAKITDILLKPQILDNGEMLPEKPDYRRSRQERIHKGFLVANDYFFFHSDLFQISPEDVPRIKTGERVFWLYGYVDYIDEFGRRHRGGYGRRYAPHLDDRNRYANDEEFEKRSNLALELFRGYNYDEPRKPGEGNDWE